MKKSFILLILILSAFFSVSAQYLPEPPEQRLSSAPKAFRTFYSGLRKAIHDGKKAQVTATIRFPFRYGFDVGDEGAMTKAQFSKRYVEVIGKKPKEFLEESDPIFRRGEDGSYYVTTENAEHLRFVKSGSRFWWVAYVIEA